MTERRALLSEVALSSGLELQPQVLGSKARPPPLLLGGKGCSQAVGASHLFSRKGPKMVPTDRLCSALDLEAKQQKKRLSRPTAENPPRGALESPGSRKAAH